MSDKKFANLHYPGIQANPDEGKTPFSPLAKSFLEPQIINLGEENSRKLFSSSILFLGSNPLTTRTAKALCFSGVGRIGILGDTEISGAHGVSLPTKPENMLPAFSEWVKKTSSWVNFEPFSNTSLDRDFEDIARGFQITVNLEKSFFDSSSNHTVSFHAHATDSQAWVCETNLCFRCTQKKLKPLYKASQNEKSFYFPQLELAASFLSTLICDFILDKPTNSLIVFDKDSTLPSIQTLTSEPGCTQCPK